MASLDSQKPISSAVQGAAPCCIAEILELRVVQNGLLYYSERQDKYERQVWLYGFCQGDFGLVSIKVVIQYPWILYVTPNKAYAL